MEPARAEGRGPGAIGRLRARPVPRDAVALHRAVPGQPHEGRRRHPAAAERVLHRRRERRRVEDHRLRPDVDADLRRPADRLDWRHRGRAVRPEHHLRRQRRGHAAAGPVHRQRHLQVHRRREDAGRTWACATGSRSPRWWSTRATPNRLLVAVPGHPYGPNEERGVFRSTDGGKSFEKVLYNGRAHGRGGPDPRSEQPGHRLRRPVGGAAGAVGERRVDRARQRPVQVHGRRHHVAAADEGPADVRRGRPGTHRHHGRPERLEAALRHRRRLARSCRHLSVGRCRRVVDSRERGSARGGSPGRRGRGPGPPRQPGHRVRADDRRVEVHRRRQDLRRLARGAGRRRLPAAVDQPRSPGHDDDGRRPGRHRHGQRRRVVEFLVQPADGADVPRQHRQRLPLPRLRRPAGKRLGLRPEPGRRRADHVPGVAARWASKSTATPCPTR